MCSSKLLRFPVGCSGTVQIQIQKIRFCSQRLNYPVAKLISGVPLWSMQRQISQDDKSVKSKSSSLERSVSLSIVCKTRETGFLGEN